MVFEAIGTMLDSFSFFGMGIYPVLAGLLFAISRGLSKDKETMMMYGIIICGFSMLFIFNNDYSKTALFLTTGVLVIIYGFKFLHVKSGGTEE